MHCEDMNAMSMAVGKISTLFKPLKEITFQHPFSMIVTGQIGSGKTEWTRKLLLISLIQPPPERILWCFGQRQPLYEDLQKGEIRG